MAFDSVMKDRKEDKDETSHLLPGYDDIFPQQETRHPRDGYEIDEVRKGGTAYAFDDQYKQKLFSTRAGSGGQAEKSFQIGLCCFAIFAVVVICILSYVLFQTSFKLYSELASGWGFFWSGTPLTTVGILEHLEPLLLLVLLLVFLVLVCCCHVVMAMPLWEKPNNVGEYQRMGKLGVCCTCFCGTAFWVLLILSFISFYTGSSGAYRASNTICRVYKQNHFDACPLHFHTETSKILATATGTIASEVKAGSTVKEGQPVVQVNTVVKDNAPVDPANPTGGRRLETTSEDIDLDLVDLEEDGDRRGAAPSLRARSSEAFPSFRNWTGRRLASDSSKVSTRKPDYDKASAFMHKKRTGPTDCWDVQALCKTQYKGFKDTTACVCKGFAKPPATTPGDFCKRWDNVKTPWCTVLPTAVCGKDKAYADVTTGRSSGPCVGPAETKYDAVYHGKQLFLLSLIASSVAAFCCCCSLCCGVYLNGQRARAGAHANAARRRGKDVGNNDKKLFQPGALSTTQGASAFERNVKLMPIEEEFRYYQEEASLRLSDSTPDATRYELYGFYHQAVQGNVQGERPSFFHHDDQMKFDAWARLNGMPRNEAMRGYCNAVKRLAPPPKASWGGAE